MIAVSLLVAGVAAGTVCWLLEGTAVWVMSGVALVLVVTGLFFAGRASEAQRKRKQRQEE